MDNKRDIERVLTIARSALSGQLGILEAVRALSPYVHSLPELFEEDANTFIGIDSETDTLPVGKLRELWHPDFLPEKDAEIGRCEQLRRDNVLGACERIIFRSGSIQ